MEENQEEEIVDLRLAHFGDKIRDLRKKRKLTQAELGEKVKFIRQTISRIENGTTETNFSDYLNIMEVLEAEVLFVDNETLNKK